MTFSIVPLAREHFEALHKALDTVAREKRYLAFTEAPPAADAYAFYEQIFADDCAVSIALEHGRVVGWCDVLASHAQARAHIGTLGMGLLPEARHRGIGLPLIQSTIAKAWDKGLSRIELTVRTDNANAKALYERVGFTTEGLFKRAFRIDGEYCDAYSMALLR